ncbi:unnamed protein product [marine sediment metagenome]|uniref:Uncharacterized protein n=1 Tax=marine sediment metagenome TaxID=412755 RepID=X1II98_9ZZZZ
MSKEIKIYIGDSVYADYDGYHIILTTNNGYGDTNTIALEPSVYDALILFNERIKQENK